MRWLIRLLDRIECHGSTLCCQHIDEPTCNSAHDRHWRGQRAFVRRMQAEVRTDTLRQGNVPHLRDAGWGPFPLPGEKKRLARARAEAEHLMTLINERDRT